MYAHIVILQSEKGTIFHEGKCVQLFQLVNSMTDMLRQTHGEHARPYAERIAMHHLAWNRTQLMLDAGRVISAEIEAQCRRTVGRCCTGEPFEYVTGSAYFYKREFTVTSAVLIPRPDTEILVETVLLNEPDGRSFFADMGCGSGILSCILTEERLQWWAVAVDCSPDAVEITAHNRRSDRVLPLCADRFTAIRAGVRFDFIVSNPPYIPSDSIGLLDPSVGRYEPHCALDGGSDGCAFYRYLADEAPKLLIPGGALYVEIGYDQGETVPQLFTSSHWKNPLVKKDHSGHSRVFVVRTIGETI